MAVQYSFVTNWKLKAPVEAVWSSIYNSLEWPLWWKGVKCVTEIRQNDDTGVNGIRKYTWKSALPYKLTFDMILTEKVLYERLKGVASGELEGTGEWFFKEKDGVTQVSYYWNVRTTKKWMNLFSFILKPLFRINHNIVMRWGAEGLAKKLNTVLINDQ